MAKIKTKPIRADWKDNWPWFHDPAPKKRKIIWIVTYWPLRPDEDDSEEDPLTTKPIQALFDWAEEIATTSQIFDYGLRLSVINSGVKETTYSFVRPDKVEEYIRHSFITSILPEFHIRLIDTESYDDWFLPDFIPHFGWKQENPRVNLDSYRALYTWGISELRILKLADLITRLLKRFYENDLSINEINLINQKANKAKIVTLPNSLLWNKVSQIGGYVGPVIENPENTVFAFPKDLSPHELNKLKNDKKVSSEIKLWLEETTDYTIIRDCETLLFLELKDLVDMYLSRRCKNPECQKPLPISTDGNRYSGSFCPPDSTLGYLKCRRSRDRERKFKSILRSVNKSPAN